MTSHCRRLGFNLSPPHTPPSNPLPRHIAWAPTLPCHYMIILGKRGFFSFSTMHILGQIILCCGGCPLHCRIRGISSLVSVHWKPLARSTQANMSPDTVRCPLGIKSPPLRTTEFLFSVYIILIARAVTAEPSGTNYDSSPPPTPPFS